MNRISFPIGCIVELTDDCRTVLDAYRSDHGLGDEAVITNVFFDTAGELMYELNAEDTAFKVSDFRVLEYPNRDSLENAFDYVQRRTLFQTLESADPVISVIQTDEIYTGEGDCQCGSDGCTNGGCSESCHGDGSCGGCKGSEKPHVGIHLKVDPDILQPNP